MFPFRKKILLDKSDEELITLYRSNQNRLCLGILYERYGHLVMGSCLKYLKNIQDAEDVTSQIFEDLHTKLLKHEITFFKSWLFMVTKNECFMRLRKSGKEGSIPETLQIQDEPTSEYHIQKEIQLGMLEKLIPVLKDDQKTCIDLFYIKEKSYQEISDELNMTLMQVKSAIQNGKRNLRIRMEEEIKRNDD